MRKFRKLLGLGLVVGLVLAVAIPVLADSYQYYIPITITETGGSSKSGIPILVDLNNQSLIDLGYLSSSGLDTRMQEAGTDRPYSVINSKFGFLVPSLSAYQSKEFNYYTSYSPDSSDFDTVVGKGGYITVSDHADLELGNNFEIEQKGWIDTSSGNDKNLVYKANAFRIYVSASGNITVAIGGEEGETTFYPDAHPESTSVDGIVRHAGTNLSWSDTRDGAGTYAKDDNTGTNPWILQTGSTAWNLMNRGIYLFDTSELPDDANISAAIFSLYGYNKGDTPGWTPDTNVYSSNPASDTALVPGDFNSLGTTPFCDTPITYANWKTTDPYWNDFAFNATGIAAISLTGVSKFGLRNANYDVADSEPSHSASTESYIEAYMAEQGTDYKPKLVVTYSYLDDKVTATGVSSGEHTIKVTADGTTLKIFVDGVEKGSAALSGASVPDNDNNWTLGQNSSIAYAEYHKITVGGTLIAHYQPIAIISGTTLPDREGTAQNGTITYGGRFADSGTTTILVDSELTQADDFWNGYTLKVVETTDGNAPEGESSTITDFGAASDNLTFGALTVAPGSGDRYEIWNGQTILWGSFPEGISVEIGALTAYTDPVSSAVGLEAPEVAIAPTEPSGIWGGAASEDLPLYPLYNQVATALGWTPDVLYVFSWFVIAIGMGVAVLITSGSGLVAVFAVGVGMAGGIATGMLPVWILFVYAILAGSWLYVSRAM